jgi:hypothetical protein
MHYSQTTGNSMTGSSTSSHGKLHLRLCQIFTTACNKFGLSRQYYAANLPSHDPEEHNQLSDIPSQYPPTSSPQIFHPYPNYNSFRLGEWYWNGGVQKSQSSFKELLNIVGDRDFDPTAVRDTKWDEINNKLGSSSGEEWLDEDAGWERTPVTIEVPYQLRRGVSADPGAGPQSYKVDDFYHRSLVSVIQEKLSNSTGNQHFHYEPYELHWQPDGAPHPVRVQGEIYTSPAFIDAHRELQNSPAEPGCNLPRAVVALMFWSDVTHLTSFGDAKIWPLYMFFGNESKYYRCKPSSHMCHHVAYFHSVSHISADY